jgi:hypothetical protein
MRQYIHGLMAVIAFTTFSVQAHGAPAMRTPASSKVEDQRPRAQCAANMELSLEEQSAIGMFHARLSHLRNHWGRPTFEAKLKQLVGQHWPQTKVIEISPAYMEKVLNLVDQARLKNSIELTIGTDEEEWQWFDQTMRTISILGMTGQSMARPLDKMALSLLQKISKAPKKDKTISPERYELVKAEALTRLADMHTWLLRWRVLNGQMLDDHAAAAAKTVAMVAIGLVGAGVLVSTLFVAAPIVAGAGAMTAGVSSSPVVSALLVKVAETAAGSAIGFFGAPAAILAQDSYQAVSEAAKQSANRQTSFSCELSIEIEKWQEKAPGRLASAAALGAGIGAVGGAMTFSTYSAKLVLYATGLGVGVAQLYAMGQMSVNTIESLAYYRMAQEAQSAGDHIMAVRHLQKARDLAQQAGAFGLETIIIAVLSYHVSKHFMHALHEGSGAIRKLYAASADTLPTAANATLKMTSAVKPGINGTAAETSCPSNPPNDINCVIDAGAVAQNR